MAGQEGRRSILEFAGTWRGSDIEEVFAQIMKDRERSANLSLGRKLSLSNKFH